MARYEHTAFPCSKEAIDEWNAANSATVPLSSMTGMTLRQWYAGMALHGLLARGRPESYSKFDMCDDAFKYADAMIELGEK